MKTRILFAGLLACLLTGCAEPAPAFSEREATHEAQHVDRKCSVCGKLMTYTKPDGTKTDMIGMLFTFTDRTTKKDPEYEQFISKQYGVYTDRREQAICWECMFRALGVKEDA